METVAYIVVKGGPAELQNHIEDIRKSDLAVAILGMLHVGWSDPEYPKMKPGDLIYNDFPGWPTGKRGNLLVSEGRFNPDNDPEIAKWPAQVAQLKQNPKGFKVLLSLGGAGPLDFTHIQNDLDFGRDPRFTRNMRALKQAVPALDGIDLDCEEGGIEIGTFAGLGALCKELRLEITFCPYSDPDLWARRNAAVQGQGIPVRWWNLQCYAGGGTNINNLQPWIDALKPFAGVFLVPGLAVAGGTDVSASDWQCPNQMRDTIIRWNRTTGLVAVFLWKYDGIGETPNVCAPPNSPLNPTLLSYVANIDVAVEGGAGANRARLLTSPRP